MVGIQKNIAEKQLHLRLLLNHLRTLKTKRRVVLFKKQAPAFELLAIPGSHIPKKHYPPFSFKLEFRVLGHSGEGIQKNQNRIERRSRFATNKLITGFPPKFIPVKTGTRMTVGGYLIR